MNILFLTLVDFDSINERNIYTDLLREFIKNGHQVYAISPVERKKKIATHIVREPSSNILKLRIGNIQKTNLIEKGISTLTVEPLTVKGIKKYFSEVKFDLVAYSTPPITFCKAIDFVKKRDNAKSYLLLKDIFPQNAVDIGLMDKKGPKGFLYRYFRKKEKKLYSVSDYIGCMSEANVEYVISNNPSVKREKIEVCPNCIDVTDMRLANAEKEVMREKYGIPLDKTVFVYGGNLGRPQGIPFFINCLKSQIDNKELFFLVIGDGTEYTRLEEFVAGNKPDNIVLMKRLPKEDYDRLVAACDIGMIFLDNRFTIPNFPSRLLAYMQAGIPVLACTDRNTDIGKVIADGKFGGWCESRDVSDFAQAVKEILENDFESEREIEYLNRHYSTKVAYETIMKHFS